jgi:dTDP-4-amino-4,6-dideoxygalactose transaminase
MSISLEPILSGNRLALSRALTAVENNTLEGRELLSALYPRGGHAHLIGVTGSPGTGKSSLVNQIVLLYRRIHPDKKVAIIAVDPTSPFSGGAVLGDRVRMRDLSGDEGIFIRSMASRGALGGLARQTASLAQLFDCAGYDLVLIETVGAGQNEVDIVRLAHTTLVVEATGLGDDIQAIKAAILEIADRYKLAVVEDNAHGLFGKYKGKYLGTFGKLAAQSFHETKNFTSGEGGALLINDAELAERAEILREKGTNRSRFFRGQVDKYTWVDLGSSYLPSDLLAAFLYAQFEQRERIQSHRKHVWDFYHQYLGEWAEKNGVQMPTIPAHTEQAYHMFYLLLPDLDTRQRFIMYLREQDIYSVFHYLPLHLSDMGRKFGGAVGDCPVTERISDQLVRLPFYNNLGGADLERIVDAILKFEF